VCEILFLSAGEGEHPVSRRDVLIEISLPDLDEDAVESVVGLFDRWGRGGAVVEQLAGQDTGPSVKTYLLAEDDEALRQIQVGLALLSRARPASVAADSVPLNTSRLPEPRMRFLSESDWAEAWKAGYDVLRIGRQLVVKPTWRDYSPRPGDRVVVLDPGMAFGSGLHSTTRLCLEALEDYLQPGATVLDAGTGSGILAIAAARLGAAHVLALDTDTLAVRVARENVILNQVESIVQVEAGTVQVSDFTHLDGAPAQEPQISSLIVVNILAETIIELTPGLVASLAPRGILIASGIIADRADAVVAKLRENSLSIVEQRRMGEWVALVARKATVG